MQVKALQPLDAERLGSAFEHSITWEDDIWKADPFDVSEVHHAARAKFVDLLEQLSDGQRVQARMLLFHGQSGAGKTHLIRALRTTSHKLGLAYFGYAQMTPDVSTYADYFLRRFINSLEKPYNPFERGESGLQRLSRCLVSGSDVIDEETLAALRDSDMEPGNLARLVMELADDIVSSERFAEDDLDINIVRALLYLQRSDPRIDQRVRQYLYGRKLNEFSQTTVAALDINEGDDRAFEIIESLSRLMKIVDNASLVFCIDQVEDLRFYDDPAERFQKAVRDLIQIANRVPSAIIIVSCLGDFYEQVRGYLTQSFIDRLEKAGPVLLEEARSANEARLIVGTRLKYADGGEGEGAGAEFEAEQLFGAEFFEEVAGLSTRRLLEMVQMRWREMQGAPVEVSPVRVVGGSEADTADTKALWDRFIHEAEYDIPSDEDELALILTTALGIGEEENREDVGVRVDPVDWIEGISAFDLTVTLSGGGARFANRIFICNKGSQGGALKRQIEKVMVSSDGLDPIIIRASDFPPQAKNATAQALRRFLASGGRRIVIPIYEWERMMMLNDFHARYKRNDGFQSWLASAQLLGDLPSIEQLLRLDLTSRGLSPRSEERPVPGRSAHDPVDSADRASAGDLPQSSADWAGPGQEADGERDHEGAGPVDIDLDWVVDAASEAGDGELGDSPANNDPGPRADGQMADGNTPTDTVARQDEGEAVTNGPAADAAEPSRVATSTGGGGSWLGDYVAGLWGALPNPMAPKCHKDSKSSHDAEDGRAEDEIIEAEAATDAADETAVEDYDEAEEELERAGRETVGNAGEAFRIGHLLGETQRPVGLSKSILKRHAAMLGGSGSGKTTLALSVVEQLLMSQIPVVLIDRKGDLASYANPDVWRPQPGEEAGRSVLREELGSMIDVAVYTPGRTSGRPISITLLPNGMAELPEHEQQQLANVSAAALSEMLHLKNSATHQRQGGVLSVALKLLGSQALSEVTLADLIFMLENEDAELIELTQRMDPSGKLRRDLIAQLDSLRHRNWALFEGGGEPLRMESLLGLGQFARPGSTRLSVIYTGFLGDNENILFWVSQFLSEALRFCQRNPADGLQAVILFDEADLYIPANSRPATSEPLQSLLKRARSAGMGVILATQSPGDLDYRSRDQITSWFIGRVREDTALRKLRAAFAAESGLDPARVLPNQTVGEFHLIQEAKVQALQSDMSLIRAEQVPFDRIEQLARETSGHDAKQLDLEL